MDTAQWPQDVGLITPMDHNNHQDEINNRGIGGERRASRPQEQLNCPRCKSTNTKFCYYNNYSLTQPRYFCKGCRRYWTNGGSLRNVPVGGGSRKNKRPSSASSYKLPDLNPPSSLHQNPNTTHLSGQDLNLSFQVMQQEHQQGSFIQLPKMESHERNNNTSSSSSSVSALDLLRTGIASRGLNSFTPMPMPDSNTLYSSSAGFTMQEFKPPQLSFPVGNRYENNAQGRLFFPFGDFSKQLAGTADEADQEKAQGTNRHWNGMLQGGGGSW